MSRSSARSRGWRASLAPCLAALLALAALGARDVGAVVLQFETPISGDPVPVTLSLSDVPGGDGVDVAVSIAPGSGDLLGLFGNVADESLLSSLAVEDPAGIVSQWQIRANRVFKVGGGNTMAPIKTWDWGLKVGATGSPGGIVVESAAFRLVAPGLTVDELVGAATQGWVFGVRVQSTQGPEGSAKVGLSGDAPRIRIERPADGSLLGATPTAVDGTVLGAGVAVDVNGVAAAVSSEAFAADVPLAEGPNTVVATGTNTLGTASDAVDVVLDTTPPVVAIATPTDGTLTAEAEILAEGTATDPSPIVSFAVNGVDVPLLEGAFSTLVPLVLGDNLIEAVAVDAAGNQGSAEVSVVRGEPPTVTIDAPSAGALFGATPIAVTGSASGVPAPQVVVNGVAASVSDGTFSASVPLVEGPNALVATATNPLGEDAAEVAVVLDTTPPAVTILAPPDGSRTTEAEVPVSGTVVDASPIASLSVNGAAATFDGSSFTAVAPLSLGDNAIAAVATDAVGNQGSDSITVARGEAPAVAITSPADGAELDVSPATVAGTVAGTPPLSVVVNGVAASVSEGGFTASVPLAEGPKTLTATATNAFGEASDAVAVALVVGPSLAVSIETPPDGATVSSSTIAVAGTVSDPEATVSVNGVAAAVNGTGWTAAAVPIAEGENLLTAAASRGSDTASDASTVVLNLPPEVVITSPRDGAILRQPATDVEGYVDDPTAFVDVNGVSARVGSAGRFLAPAVPLEAGPNRLTARAIDPEGGTGKDAVDVTRDDATAGRLRIVLVLPLLPEGQIVPVEDEVEFGEALRAAGFPPERFAPTIEAPAVGFSGFAAFVFAEAGTLGEPVSAPALTGGFFFEDPPLLPMDQLADAMAEAGLEPAVRSDLVPDDFVPNGFALFHVFGGAPQ